MIPWPKASKTDLRLFEAVSRVFRNHPYLLEFLFDPREPRLRLLSEELLERSRDFSSGEDLLIRVALDLWSGGGEARIWELLEYLDDENLFNVTSALQFLRTKPNGWSGPVLRQ